MTPVPPSFAIFGNTYQQSKADDICRVLDCLADYDAMVYAEEEYFRFLVAGGLVTPGRVFPFRGPDIPARYVLSLGGDGTLLRTAAAVGRRQLPIVGVNMGRLGFLADIGPDDVEQAVRSLILGSAQLDERVLLHVETIDGEPLTGCDCALNDVAILKRDSASMISIEATIDGERLTTYQADGLIVSTPTGSTAYSLSNGGPIIVPRTGVTLLTAVAPHSLNVRPIVIPDSAVVELTVTSRSKTFLVAIDGRSEKLASGTKLRLSRADYTVRLVRRSGIHFFTTLREKMMWGADTRQ